MINSCVPNDYPKIPNTSKQIGASVWWEIASYIYDMKIYFNIPYKSLKALRNVVFFNSNDSMIFNKKSETEVNVNNLDCCRIRLKR